MVAVGTLHQVEEVALLPGGGGCVAVGSGGWVAARTPRRVGEATSLLGGGCCIAAGSVRGSGGGVEGRSSQRDGVFFLLGMERGIRVHCGARASNTERGVGLPWLDPHVSARCFEGGRRRRQTTSRLNNSLFYK
jgi:hypothetical protein